MFKKSFQQLPRSNARDTKSQKQDAKARRSLYVCLIGQGTSIMSAQYPQKPPRRSSAVSSSGSSNGDLTLVGSSVDDLGLITY